MPPKWWLFIITRKCENNYGKLISILVVINCSSIMKKRIWVVIVNILIMFAMLSFVVVYSTLEAKKSTETQIAHFENTTITMERVTENYLGN